MKFTEMNETAVSVDTSNTMNFVAHDQEEEEMSGAYGVITFTKSPDCVFDTEEMKDLLNTFYWASSGDGTWECDDQLLFVAGDSSKFVQDPSSMPKKVGFYMLLKKDGKIEPRDPSDMDSDDWDNIFKTYLKPLALDEASDAISELLENGWIQIACVAKEEGSFFYSESTRVYADGAISTRQFQAGLETESSDFLDEDSCIFPTNQSNKGENYVNV